jgi:hypothetical protein
VSLLGSCAKAPDENRAAAAVVAMMNVCMMGSLVRPDDSPEAFAQDRRGTCN